MEPEFWIGLLAATLIMISMVRLVKRQVDDWGNTGPAPLPLLGPTIQIARVYGRGSIYVGRSGPHAWIQMPEHEAHLTPDEARAIAQALHKSSEDARIYSAQNA